MSPAVNCFDDSNRAKVLYIGDTGFETWRDIAGDPLLITTAVPASVGHFPSDQIERYMRQYIPRTYTRYSSDVDLLILSDTDRQLFTTKQQTWFKKGVFEEGQGLIMAGGLEAFGGAGWGSSWEGSSVADVLPVNLLTGEVWNLHPFHARPTEESSNHPLITSLPWNTMPTFGGMNRVTTKTWAEVLLKAAGPGISSSENLPVLVHGEVGEGSSLAHTPDWNPGWGGRVMREWEYYPDYLINMAYLMVGVSIPQNLQLSHLVRTELANHIQRMSVTLSFLEFAEDFGANIHPLEMRLSKAAQMKDEADALYIDQDLEAVLEKMRQVRDLMDDINQQAIELKDRALVWVYAVEWLAVTGTFLVCGFILWTLMVRKRFYKRVEMTKLQG